MPALLAVLEMEKGKAIANKKRKTHTPPERSTLLDLLQPQGRQAAPGVKVCPSDLTSELNSLLR